MQSQDVFYVRPDLVLAVDTSHSTRGYRSLVEAAYDRIAEDFLNNDRHIAVVNFARGYGVLGFTQDPAAIKEAAKRRRSDERYDAATSLPANEIASLVESRHQDDAPVCVAYVVDPSIPRNEFYGLLDSARPDASLVFLLERSAKKAPFWKRPFMKYPQRLAEAEAAGTAELKSYLSGRGAHVYPIRNRHDIDALNFDDVSVPIALEKNSWLAVG